MLFIVAGGTAWAGSASAENTFVTVGVTADNPVSIVDVGTDFYIGTEDDSVEVTIAAKDDFDLVEPDPYTPPITINAGDSEDYAEGIPPETMDGDGTINVVKVDIVDPAENDVFLHGDNVTFKAEIDPNVTVDSWDWEIIEGDGSPSSSSTDTYEPVVRNADEDYDTPDIFKVKVTATIGGTECTDELQVKVVYPKIDIIDFKSTKSIIHEGDWKTHDPEWNSSMMDESVSVFTRNTKIEVDATFKTILALTDPAEISRLYANVAWWVTGDCDLESEPMAQTVSGNSTVITMEGTSDLIDEIYAYEESWLWTRNLKYEWFYEMADTGSENHTIKPVPGDNRHDLYVTLNDPDGTYVYETVLHISCNAARGEDTVDDTIDEVWDDFTDQDVRKKSGSAPMTYYGNDTQPYSAKTDLIGLLKSGDGRCGTWWFLLDSALRVQGIAGQSLLHIHIDPGKIPINNYVNTAKADYYVKYGNTPSVDGYNIVWDVFFVKNWDLSSPDKWNAVDETGVEGQGNSNPLAVFNDHALMEINTKVYDPSYGTGPFDSLLEWEDASLDGYGVHFFKWPSGLAADFKFWIGKEDAKNVQEVK